MNLSFSKWLKIAVFAGVLLGLINGLELVGAAVKTVCSTGADFTNIQDAINAAIAEETITVCPGEYRGTLLIGKSVTLSGASPAQVRILGGIIVAGLNITVTLEGFTVAGGLNGITVFGLSHVLVRNVVITKNAADGIAVFDLSRVTIANALIAENGTNIPALQPIGSGISIGGAARVSLSLSTISKNVVDGITLNDRGSLETFAFTEISANGKDGVAVCGFAQAALHGALITGNGGHGVFVADNAEGYIRGASLTKNKRNGIQVGGLCGDLIGGGTTYGSTKATIINSVITGNGGHGISAGNIRSKGKADVGILSNRIEGSGQCGIWMLEPDAQVTESDNTLSNNPAGNVCKVK